MSRSRKKAIVKDGTYGGEYWRVIRREWKQKLKHNYYLEGFSLRNNRSIINDWDFCDYIVVWEYGMEPTKYLSEDDIKEQIMAVFSSWLWEAHINGAEIFS